MHLLRNEAFLLAPARRGSDRPSSGGRGRDGHPPVNRGKLFLWVSVVLALICFVAALATAIPMASKIRLLGSDESHSGDLLVEAREKLEAGDLGSARRLID